MGIWFFTSQLSYLRSSWNNLHQFQHEQEPKTMKMLIDIEDGKFDSSASTKFTDQPMNVAKGSCESSHTCGYCQVYRNNPFSNHLRSEAPNDATISRQTYMYIDWPILHVWQDFLLNYHPFAFKLDIASITLTAMYVNVMIELFRRSMWAFAFFAKNSFSRWHRRKKAQKTHAGPWRLKAN